MSDDIPLIFAEELRAAVPRRAVFLSAASAAQMQQYATGGWQVVAAPDFQSAAAIDLATVPATTGDQAALSGATLISLEAPTWPGDAAVHLARWRPALVKVNCAFHGLADDAADSIADTLRGLGYTLLAAHWRDDNIFGLRSLSRLERFEAFGAPDWKRTNLIAVRDPAAAERILIVARLYVGEERRIAELRLSQSIRNDHIARLEDALMVRQRGSR